MTTVLQRFEEELELRLIHRALDIGQSPGFLPTKEWISIAAKYQLFKSGALDYQGEVDNLFGRTWYGIQSLEALIVYDFLEWMNTQHD